MPEGAVYVGRPTKWGNPFRAVPAGNGFWTVVDDNDVDYRHPRTGWADKDYAVLRSVQLFAELSVDYEIAFDCDAARAELRGKDLACWCPLDAPCHADVLLELANSAASLSQKDNQP